MAVGPLNPLTSLNKESRAGDPLPDPTSGLKGSALLRQLASVFTSHIATIGGPIAAFFGECTSVLLAPLEDEVPGQHLLNESPQQLKARGPRGKAL